ncbi:MAG TPA: ATP-binding protein [Tissierellia bacterium]|nr:ATP-binding protein [Tissierellia bacterium]
MGYVIEKKIHSDINCVKILVEEILSSIKHKLSETTFFNTKLILYELMINSVIHGNCEDLNKMIYTKIYINKSRIIIEVSDEGEGICYNQKIYNENDLSESGRGLMLVKGLADKFDIRGNTVICEQYLK